jgi:hypothetical protein
MNRPGYVTLVRWWFGASDVRTQPLGTVECRWVADHRPLSFLVSEHIADLNAHRQD